MALTFGLVCSLASVPALADPQFFFEAQPMFDNCGDPSLARAQKDGITLGFSNNPPEVWLDESAKQPNGIDWDINKAALECLRVRDLLRISVHAARWKVCI